VFLSEICWRSGVPIEGEQEGEGRSFRETGRGKHSPPASPERVTSEALSEGIPAFPPTTSGNSGIVRVEILEGGWRDAKGWDIRRMVEGMRGLRRSYYNLFSRVYDTFISLHSGDAESLTRKFIAEKARLCRGDWTLDLCTGTGSVALELARAVGEGGMVVGLDFSHGMLKKAREKSKVLKLHNLHFVEADAVMLPFKGACFNAVTCSHAFYELKGSDRKMAVDEVGRVTREGGRFCLMEHAEPEGRLAKLLFFLRIRFLGSSDAKGFLEKEMDLLADRFRRIRMEMAPTGKSKLIWGERRDAG